MSFTIKIAFPKGVTIISNYHSDRIRFFKHFIGGEQQRPNYLLNN
ncbi:hypothetical protein SAMN05444371_2948 [Epilithonimonas mollis]|uniref:Uncharacterized protein n=1 Tax=Epilithonimonas mollis TaxID=216903 RepID=A0A1M6TUE8_9FLAO|nr:hypothetical protein SAMN05444371_2948 [Epilithonimonas mollis]